MILYQFIEAKRNLAGIPLNPRKTAAEEIAIDEYFNYLYPLFDTYLAK
jgi:hypothetical protein